MSSKIDVGSIVSGHIQTLVDSRSGKKSVVDYVTFFGLPIILATILSSLGIKLSSDANALLVNFGAIFTALLLSVLVLVYDQGEKLEKTNDVSKKHTLEAKSKLLNDLYFNICYSIIVSVLLVALCLFYTFLPDETYRVSLYKFTLSVDIKLAVNSPLILMTVFNLLLTIIMIVKRMHTLLIMDK